MFKQTILAALLAVSLPALASDYYVVVPVPNRTATDGNILVALNSYSLPTGMTGHAYAGFDFNSVLQVKGDPTFSASSVRWSVAGGALPAGLTLSSTGKLTGTPSAAGTSSFQVLASYKTKAGQQGYQVLVAAVTVGLASATLPAGIQGAAYSFDLKPSLSSNDPSFTPESATWSVVSGALPAGLQLNSNGTISGVPAEEGTHPFTVQANYLTATGQQTYQVMVGAISVSLNPSTITLPVGAFGVPYSQDLKPNVTVQGDAAYAGNGAGVTWTLVSGALPSGLAIDANSGIISGTPTARATGAAQIQASYKDKSATQSVSISLNESVKQYTGYRAWSDGTLAASCKEYLTGKTNYVYGGATGDGIYRIDVDGAGALTPVDVLCDMTTDGGGWTVIQNRWNGSVDFYQGWAAYAAGFGSASSEYWMGNDRIAALTAVPSSIRIDLSRVTGETAYAVYSSFKVSPASDKYRLALGSYVSGTAGDSFSGTGLQFSTFDNDNDSQKGNCAVQYKGAWWYTACHTSNLNGAYLNGVHTTYADGIEWYTWTGYYESLKTSAMKVRAN